MASSPDATPSPDISPPAPPSDDASATATAPPTANSSASPPPPESSPSVPPPSLPPPQSPPPLPPQSPPPVDSPPPQSSPPPPSPPANASTPPAANASTPPAATAPPLPSSTPPSPEISSPPPPPPPISLDAPSAPLPATPSTQTFEPPPPPRSGRLSPPSQRTPSNPSPSRNTPPPSNSDNSGPNLSLVLGLTVGVGLFIVVMLVALVLCARKKKKKPPPPNGGFYQAGPLPKWQNGGQGMEYGGNLPPPPGAWGQSPPPPMASSGEMSSCYSAPHGAAPSPTSPNVGLGFSKSSFTYDELASATKGFNSGNLLGQGGFGYVYKGVLPNGKEIAVKQLKSGSGQGEREFQAEVEIISRVHHRHLVSLVGYCIAGAQRMLVYEFVPNGTLEHHLHGKGVPTMDWHTRLKIAIGSAKGLAYLHEDCHPRIIHRDIKTANILLDSNFEAMVADFGLAKFTSDTNTHVSTRIMGTFGYLAPEYASTGKLTEKSDVFSFGVILLEMITGRRPVDNYMEESLVDWTRPLLTQASADENFDELADPRLGKNYDAAEMARMAACAASCVRHSARRRPKMSQIVRALDGDVSLEDLNEGVKPGQSAIFSSSSEYEQGTYSSKMKEFRKAAFGSYDYSNDFSVATSEYGLNPSESSSSGEESTAGSRREMPPSHHNL